MKGKPIKGVIALTKEFSGVAGEARIAAELVRNGFRVAKPYWNHDEIDLLLIDKSNDRLIPIPIQVKSIQFIPNKNQKLKDKNPIQGLRKKYVDNNFALCLAIYRPDLDNIWFINGNKNIIRVYEEQQSWNKRHKKYESLKEEDDIRIYVPYDINSTNFLSDWLLSKDDPIPLRKRITEIKEEMTNYWDEVMKMSFFLDI